MTTIKMKIPDSYFVGSSSLLQQEIYDWVRETRTPVGHPKFDEERHITFMDQSDAIRFKMNMPEWTAKFENRRFDEHDMLRSIVG